MIGVRPKKNKTTDSPDVPDFNLEEGQAAIYGQVTERKTFDNSIVDAFQAEVSIYKNGTLVSYAVTAEDGLYQIGALDAGENYTIEFRKDSVVVTPEFSLASKEVKQVNVELTSDNFSYV